MIIMKVLFDQLAKLELDEAVAFYEVEIKGLGRRFKHEVKSAIRRIQEYPYTWPKEKGELRRYLLHKFPYKIVYSVERDYLYIIAVAHCHRHPEYWIDRVLGND